jgi:hypothetical protein
MHHSNEPLSSLFRVLTGPVFAFRAKRGIAAMPGTVRATFQLTQAVR